MSACQFGRHRFQRLAFRQDIQGPTECIGIAYNILIVGYDVNGKDHGRTLR